MYNSINYLFPCQESGYAHGSVKLVLDDPEVAAVLDLRLDDLGDDLLAFASAFGTRKANGSVGIEYALSEMSKEKQNKLKMFLFSFLRLNLI